MVPEVVRARTSSLRSRVVTGSVVAALLVGLGVAVGAVAALAAEPAFTAESRLVVGEQGLAAARIPGYVAATQALAGEYARYAENTPELREQLPRGGEGVLSVTASPIPESSVIRVEVRATAGTTAVDAANAVSQVLIERVGAARPDVSSAEAEFSASVTALQTAQAEAEAASARLEALQNDPDASAEDVGAAQAEVDQRAVRVATAELQQQALGGVYRDAYASSATSPTLVVIRPASGAVSDSRSRLQRNGLLGAVVGALVAAAVVQGRRRLAAGADGRPARRREADDALEAESTGQR